MSDWTEQWDGWDVCEVCEQLVPPDPLYERASLAVTMLYTLGVMTGVERDRVRARLSHLAAKVKGI